MHKIRDREGKWCEDVAVKRHRRTDRKEKRALLKYQALTNLPSSCAKTPKP
jgi:hypothetical protein